MTAAKQSVSDLVRAGGDTLVRMALRGDLEPRHLWVAVRGAQKYREAVAHGDVASDAELRMRGERCQACPHATREPSAIAGTEKVYCGTPFEPGEQTCGCLVGVSVNGVLMPGGKPSVRTETCWGWE